MKRKRITLIMVLSLIAAALVLCILVVAGMNQNTRMIRHSSDHLVFYCQKESVPQAKELSPYLEACYDKAMTALGLSSGKKISLILYSTMDEYEQAREKAGADPNPYAFLVRETVHVAPGQTDELSRQTVAYHTIRALTRTLTDRPQNGRLADSIAAYAAYPGRFTELKLNALEASKLTVSQLTSTQSTESYEAILNSPEYTSSLLFVIFLSEEGLKPSEPGSLWRILRAREPCNYARATGYDEAAWDQTWKAWLQDFRPYALADELPGETD